jgi:hypothetical protein
MPSSSPASRRFWAAQGDLATLAYRDLLKFWQGLDHSDAYSVRRAVEAFLPDLVQTYGEIGASVAADFYEELRDTSPDVRRVYTAEMPGNVVPLFGATPNAASALSNLSGVTKRLVLKPGRDTVRLNVAQDPDSVGWRRIGDGDSCKFCRMLIGRGEVYTAETARFGAHDDCGCLAEPAWGAADPIRVEQYVATKRNLTDSDRARVRDFLANMDDAPATTVARAA